MNQRFIPIVSLLAMGLASAYPAFAQAPQAAATPAKAMEAAKLPSAAESLRLIKASLQALQANVTSSMSGLNAVKNAAKEGAALDRPHADFLAQFLSLESQLSTVRQQAATARNNSEAYFQNWQTAIATIQNKDIKETANDRFNSAKSRYNKVLATAEEARQKIQPFMVDLKDINTFLKIDLTADSVKSLSNTTWRLGRNAEGLVDAIAEVNKDIDIVLESLPKN